MQQGWRGTVRDSTAEYKWRLSRRPRESKAPAYCSWCRRMRCLYHNAPPDAPHPGMSGRVSTWKVPLSMLNIAGGVEYAIKILDGETNGIVDDAAGLYSRVSWQPSLHLNSEYMPFFHSVIFRHGPSGIYADSRIHRDGKYQARTGNHPSQSGKPRGRISAWISPGYIWNFTPLSTRFPKYSLTISCIKEGCQLTLEYKPAAFFAQIPTC